jgi:hypothetical protein
MQRYKDNYADHMRGLAHDLQKLGEAADRMVELAPKGETIRRCRPYRVWAPPDENGKYHKQPEVIGCGVRKIADLKSIRSRIKSLAKEVGQYVGD